MAPVAIPIASAADPRNVGTEHPRAGEKRPSSSGSQNRAKSSMDESAATRSESVAWTAAGDIPPPAGAMVTIPSVELTLSVATCASAGQMGPALAISSRSALTSWLIGASMIRSHCPVPSVRAILVVDTEPLAALVGSGSITALDPQAGRRGTIDPRWRLILNRPIEPDV